ncbi:hypothetical protein [Methanococcus maripaludis]|uniref:PEGA domain-containing protein n=1 Tax=Methanococcus maripaludis OS7 TaxID=637915 RepID=A0A2Z5PIB5_METMI|nr:hypothetical protein [Methanococcus maripaludis]BAP62593.1 hypothetical protein MMOS7_05070 [Methanococcus maripaludis OS7]
MIKRYFLFLLLLVFSFNVVNANIVVPSVVTPTDYYVLIADNYNDTTIQDAITAVTYSQYTPVVTGIENNKIYFNSEKDLARFLMPYDYNNYAITPSCVMIPNGQVLYTYVQGASARTLPIESNTTKIYLLSKSWYGGGYTLSEDGTGLNTLSSGSYQNTYGYFDVNTVSGVLSLYQWCGAWDRGTLSYIYVQNPVTSSLVGFEDKGYSQIMGILNIYALPDTQIYEGSELLGTTDNGGYIELQLPAGPHNLKFIKEGYWDILETYSAKIETQEVYISLSPKSSIFQVSKEFSGNLYPNSIGTLSMDITPVKDAYASKLRISGVDVNKVYYLTQELPRSADGYYILGDVSSTQNIEIDFKTPSSWGEKTFTVELSATDIEGTAYNNLETINYEVLELPFLLEMPETFGIGINDITLTDQSGTAYSVLIVLYDSENVELWSSSTNLLEYCDYTFEVPIDDAGDYTLELNAKAGTVKTYYSIDIIEPVTLITDEITVNPGNVATVQFKISNPTSNVKYYTAELTCPFYNESIAKTFSIAPETVDKTVDISFEVPEELELENYQLSLEIFDPDKTDAIYSGNVVLTISSSSLFLASIPGGNTTLILLAAAVLLIAGTFAALRLKK